jgi:transcriptional antiterminator RfaH
MPAFWGVVRSLPKREAFAAERLRMDHGFEVFLPLIQTQRASAPLFNGYFFCRIVDRWRSINSTFGVLCLVRVGDCPARCPDHEVDSLKAMIDAHGYIKLPEAPPPPVRRKIAIGARVRITAGPFGGMNGLYAGMSTKDRERSAPRSRRATRDPDRGQPGRSGAVEGRGSWAGNTSRPSPNCNPPSPNPNPNPNLNTSSPRPAHNRDGLSRSHAMRGERRPLSRA